MMTKMAMTLWRLLMVGGLLMALVACRSLPNESHLPSFADPAEVGVNEFYALHTPISTAFFDKLRQTTTAYPTLTGYHLLGSGADAFASRVDLIDLSNKNIDIQYYIWHDDEAGRFVLKKLWQAAERGVKVRLLLDDFNSTLGLDQQLLDFASHPNISVRLANPFVYRHFKRLNFISHPKHANARMHNKSMTFDGELTIIGGRNIGNEYLHSHHKNNFADLDVLLVGQAVNEVHDSFEQYWHSPLVYDIEMVVRQNHAPRTHFLYRPDELDTYQKAMLDKTPSLDIAQGRLPLRWANVHFFADDVKKLGQTAQDDELLIHQLRQVITPPKHHLSIISSYFVPTKSGVKALGELVKKGVNISILTNAYNATDVHSVHSGYGRWRKSLLQAGIKLYESKNTAKSKMDAKQNKPLPTMSLHAKAFAVDDSQVYIGSYNIDPRSAHTNTELGVVIDDGKLAHHFHHALNNMGKGNPTLLYQAYQVELDNKGRLQWRTIENGKEVIYHKEPKMTLFQKSNVALLTLLPIEGLL